MNIVNFLKDNSKNIKSLLGLRFFRLLVSVTIILFLTILICFYYMHINPSQLIETDLKYYLTDDHLIIAVGGVDSFMLSLSIKHNCQNTENFSTYLTNKLVDLLRKRDIKFDELDKYQLELIKLTDKYSEELLEVTLNNIIRQKIIIERGIEL